MRHLMIAMSIVTVIAAITGFTAYAQDNTQFLKFEGNYQVHETTPFVVYFERGDHAIESDDHVWIWNPNNATFTYGDDHAYTADPIHVGEWDILQVYHADDPNRYSLNDDLFTDGLDRADFVMTRHFMNVTNHQAALIDDQQEQIDQLISKLGKQGKRILDLENQITLMNKQQHNLP